ncbi:hypothetical protein [Carboxydocella sp. JDF658]|uniref:hypothetical protein n=1 Tax=Carboxydocella sp. JDF658 TaxID=1926600 RepID=UPI0009AE1C2C|nr:hypothetical protein [Carboxydocella sp. JDF658]GAW32747.1 hypothetical protein JDF658_25120 [Carboxydocella sp. JDF658]
MSIDLIALFGLSSVGIIVALAGFIVLLTKRIQDSNKPFLQEELLRKISLLEKQLDEINNKNNQS